MSHTMKNHVMGNFMILYSRYNLQGAFFANYHISHTAVLFAITSFESLGICRITVIVYSYRCVLLIACVMDLRSNPLQPTL